MAPRKLPKEEFVENVLRDVLSKRLEIDTQERLAYLVLSELKKYDPDFVISPERVKNIALRMPEVEVKVKTKKVPEMKKPVECPVCGGKIQPIYGKNLLGKKIIIGYRCTQCDYTTDLESFLPMKYIFIWKPK